MANKQSQARRLTVTVLCLSVLVILLSMSTSGDAANDVHVVNPASDPVLTRNVGGGAATLVGQPASKLVNLQCTDGNSCHAFPGLSTPFMVPSGEVLVITDVQFFFKSAKAQGNYDYVFLNTSLGTALILPGLVDASGNVAGQTSMASGLVVSGGSISIQTVTTPMTVSGFVEGYLVPNQ